MTNKEPSMSKDTKRLGIKLNKDTVIAINELKEALYGTPDIPVSESYLIEEAYKKISPILKKRQLNWDTLNKDGLPNIDSNIYSKTTLLHTTLTLNLETYSSLLKIQSEMHEATGKRIFFSFVVKLILFAAIHELQGNLETYLR